MNISKKNIFRVLLIIGGFLSSSCSEAEDSQLSLSANFETELTVEVDKATVALSNKSENAQTYQWSFKDGTPESSTEENPTVTYSKNGKYVISLIASDGKESDSHEVEISIDGVISQTEVPKAIMNYQSAANSENIDNYMEIFADGIEITDVSRVIKGKAAIREWALREVISNGDTFALIKILELKEGYAKTEVKWLSWEVHYFFWWNKDDKITKMSLQYKS